MKLAKSIGVISLAFGVIVLVVPAVLPATIVREGSGILEFETRPDGCGSAVYAAFEHKDRSCGQAARQRLVWTTTIGLLLIVVGVYLTTGSENASRSRLSTHH